MNERMNHKKNIRTEDLKVGKREGRRGDMIIDKIGDKMEVSTKLMKGIKLEETKEISDTKSEIIKVGIKDTHKIILIPDTTQQLINIQGLSRITLNPINPIIPQTQANLINPITTITTKNEKIPHQDTIEKFHQKVVKKMIKEFQMTPPGESNS